jgi:hypothetical protein
MSLAFLSDALGSTVDGYFAAWAPCLKSRSAGMEAPVTYDAFAEAAKAIT